MRRLAPFVPAMILAVGSTLLWSAQAQRSVPLAGPLDSVLSAVPGYMVAPQTLSDEERRVAGMSAYVARAYVRDSVVVFTTLVSYYARQTQGKTIHSPKNCLPGAGWEIMQGGTATVTVDGVPHVVNRYVLRNGPATALAYYWYQGRGRVVSNEYRVKWNLLRDAAFLGHTEEALVRVVVPVPMAPQPEAGAGSELLRADSTATAISGQLIRAVSRVLPGYHPETAS